jgi:hypothetical protein
LSGCKPPLWLKLVGIRAPHSFAAMDGPCMKKNVGPLRQQPWQRATVSGDVRCPSTTACQTVPPD